MNITLLLAAVNHSLDQIKTRGTEDLLQKEIRQFEEVKQQLQVMHKQQFVQHLADKQLIDGFIDSLHQHIIKTPIGGYLSAEESQVIITVGKQSLVYYDHAALMQSLLDSLEHLKTEL